MPVENMVAMFAGRYRNWSWELRQWCLGFGGVKIEQPRYKVQFQCVCGNQALLCLLCAFEAASSKLSRLAAQ